MYSGALNAPQTPPLLLSLYTHLQFQRRWLSVSYTLGPAVRSTVLGGGLSALLLVFSVCFPRFRWTLRRLFACQDVSIHVPQVLHGEGGGPPLHQGLLLGSTGDPGVRRHRLPADAPGRRSIDTQPLGQGCEPGVGRTPAPALEERPALDGAVLHRGAGQRQRQRRGTGSKVSITNPRVNNADKPAVGPQPAGL